MPTRCIWTGNGEGLGGSFFCDPLIQQFLVSINRFVLINRCVLLWLKCTSRNANCYKSLIVSREYTYIEQINSLLVNSVFCFAFSFSASKGKRKVERHLQHIFCKGTKLKIRLKKHNPLIRISHSLKVTLKVFRAFKVTFKH